MKHGYSWDWCLPKLRCMHGRISMALALEHKFVRAITDFWAGDPGELSCTTNDLLRVLHKESRKTVFAENLMSKDRGNIPNYCVAPVDVPIISQNHILFFASKAYTSLESGDLAFEKGRHRANSSRFHLWSPCPTANRGCHETLLVQIVFGLWREVCALKLQSIFAFAIVTSNNTDAAPSL